MVGKYCILVADDDPEVHQLVRDALDTETHEIMDAADGTTALHITQELTPDLVIVDVGIPKTNGIEVVRLLRDADNTRHIPIIVLAEDGDRDALASFGVGASDLIAKPFAPAMLRARVDTWLLRSEEEEAA
jgi:DNA-binding response OmpR family regulator